MLSIDLCLFLPVFSKQFDDARGCFVQSLAVPEDNALNLEKKNRENFIKDIGGSSPPHGAPWGWEERRRGD